MLLLLLLLLLLQLMLLLRQVQRRGRPWQLRLAVSAPLGGGRGCVVVVPIAEQVSLLARAAVCAVLAPAGPARQRVMGALARDPRLGHAGIPPAVRALLLRMCRRQFVAPGDAAAFEAGLQVRVWGGEALTSLD